VLHLARRGLLQTVLALEGTVDAVAPFPGVDTTRVAVVRGDEVSDWRLTSAGPDELPRAEQLWRTHVRSSGLRPSLFRLGDGRIVCAEGPINPRLAVFGADGRLDAVLALPGLCWRMGGWNASPILFAKLLIGNQFAACRIDTNDGRVDLLPDSEDLALLAGDRALPGIIYGLRLDGEVVAWSDKGKPRTLLRLDLPGAAFRSFATDGRRFAVLGGSDGRHWMHVREPVLAAGDRQP
jgi:hypothetical protein